MFSVIYIVFIMLFFFFLTAGFFFKFFFFRSIKVLPNIPSELLVILNNFSS